MVLFIHLLHTMIEFQNAHLSNENSILKPVINVCTGINRIKPILRPLSDMTEEEEAEYLQIVFSHEHSNTMRNLSKDAEGVKYLLSKGFDLFGLIEEGLAIGKPLK